MNLSTEQKLMAMKALTSVVVSWSEGIQQFVVSPDVEICDGHVLKGVAGYGELRVDAVDDAWEKLTNIKPTETLVIDGWKPSRREYFWNGFMWKEFK